MKRYILLLFASLFSSFTFAQVNARLFQFPDVSKTQITFSYAGDIWLVSKNGGSAVKLSSPAGQEIFPKFSPDGKTIAFSGNYNGNTDVYTISTKGGMPKRLTYHGYPDRVVDWYPDGSKILFASRRKSGKERFNQFYYTGSNNGLPVKLPFEHAEYGSISKDGKTFAFTDKSRLSRTWKRYRGGTAPDIWLMNMETLKAEKIAKNDANDELPMIKGDKVYFLSDRGAAKRFNLWVYDMTSKEVKQLTTFTDYDMHFPSMGPDDIVFEAGGKLYLFNLSTNKQKEVIVDVVTDYRSLLSKTVNVKGYTQNAWISFNGKRVVFEARGDIFSIPEEHGYVANLTNSSGVAERFPSWSPNGKYIAYWSDKGGEYQLVLRDLKDNSERAITSYTDGYRYQAFWSPDSKKLVFIDQAQNIQMLLIETGELVDIDKLLYQKHYGLSNFKVNWDSNSQWIAYARDTKSRTTAIALYNVKDRTVHQVTQGYYNDFSPAFDPDGKYLYFLTNRHFSPKYSDFDNTFIYNESTMLAAVPLTDKIESPLVVRNDETEIKAEEKDSKESKGDKEGKDKKRKKKKEKEEKAEVKETKIDLTGFEQRVVLLPPSHNNYATLSAAKGKVLYINGDNELKYYDLKEREEKSIIKGIRKYQLSADGKKILIRKGAEWYIIEPKANQKADKALPAKEMQMDVNPKKEWKQIFTEAWRLERDFFYDKNMHGVDWKGVYNQYLPLLEQCATRWDVNFVLGEMIGELSSSHSYKGGGDTEHAKTQNVGYLGIDYDIKDGHYFIKHIVDGAVWDAEKRSPLLSSNIDVDEGDYILAVNGNDLDISQSPYAAFQGLAGETVELLVNSKPERTGAKKIIIKTMSDEFRIRHLQWIEKKRKRVDKATDGKAGYIFVTSTGIDGQNELIRQFMGQWTKPALIIDERFNNGGQIPDRFIELLNRRPLAYWAVRDGSDMQYPPVAHLGPEVMMINGWSGSGGDAFPAYFRKEKLGELVGTRTWGGLIGISGAPMLIDGGVVTVPTFRMYDPETGKWFKEGHGVEPDIEVDEDAGELAKGVDPQLEKAIEVILKKLETETYIKPDRPAYEVR